ncbi:MAG: TerC family protein [Gammaproteobacteria bacterium]|nr:MAG: TerC family protein [Gammaproteobacteria bacterium]
MEWIFDPTAWLGFFTLIVLEIVLGIDNLIFVAVLANKLPKHQRDRARVLGLSMALLLRLGLLAGISWLVTLTAPLVNIFNQDFSGRDVILIIGGLFLLFKATIELHERVEGKVNTPRSTRVHAAFWAVIAQIIVLDAIFSLDAVITAVGIVNQLSIMMLAVIIAMVMMIIASKALTEFVNKHPTVVMLCLGFLLMIGFSLVAEGAGLHIPKGYLYGAIAFSVLIEFFNQLARSNRTRHLIGERPLRDRTAEAVLKLLGGRSDADEVGHDIVGIADPKGEELAFENSERQMIRSVLQLSDRSVQSLMTPRPDIIWVDVNATPEELLNVLKTTPQTRLLVARDELDNLHGVVQSRDLLTAALSNQPLNLAALAVEPLAVPESTSALNVLEMLRQQAVPLAIVIDEYGSIKGVVTTSDLLGAIAGELADVNDVPLIVEQEDGKSWLLDGSLSLEQLDELLGIKLEREDGDYFTLAGLVLEQLQHIPTVGETISMSGFEFEITQMEGRRILQVMVRGTPRHHHLHDDESH